jgi:hypothetical protein
MQRLIHRRLQTLENKTEMTEAKRYRVVLQPSGLQFEQVPHLSLLQSGLPPASACPTPAAMAAAGPVCANCPQAKSPTRSNGPADPEEKAEGWLLPCVAEARSDLVLMCRMRFRCAATDLSTADFCERRQLALFTLACGQKASAVPFALAARSACGDLPALNLALSAGL